MLSRKRSDPDPINQIFEAENSVALLEALGDPQEKEKVEEFLTQRITSKLFELKTDAFVKTVIQNLEPHIWKITSRNDGREENLLHFFINQKFFESIHGLFSTNDPHVAEIIFEQNKAGNTPIMSIFKQKDEDKMEKVKRQIWTIMKKPGNYERIAEASKVLGQRKMSILHLCAQTEDTASLLKILKEIDQSQLQEVIFHKSGEGKTILDMCRDECTVIQILDMLKFPAAEESIKYSDKRNRNLFNCWARRNFHRAIYYIQTRTSKEVFREMVLKKSANRNNPMMVAALHNNKESLDMFLFHVGSHPRLYTEDIDDILHSQDDYGDTLMALVVQQSGRLDAAKNILLDMEKKHHAAEATNTQGQDLTEGRRALTKCLRMYLEPSLEAQNLVNDVENSMPKTCFKKAAIWVKVFLKSLFIPILVLFLDMLFDALLVHQYHSDDDSDYEAHFNICRGINGSDFEQTNFTILEQRMSSTMPFVCSPLALNRLSRLNYSLVFVISPWFIYYIEYCQSDHWQESSQVKI